jgi:putative PIN family toxin of toxin-antitoxin system
LIQISLVRALISGSGPAKKLLISITGSSEHILLLSPFLLSEFERVLSYDRIQRLAKLNQGQITQFMKFIRSKKSSEIIFPGPAPRIIPADIDDDPILHTAVIGKADFLCTLNKDFHHPLVLEYCKARSITIGTDVELLALILENTE